MQQYIRALIAVHRRGDERGASAVEYGLLVIGVALAVILALAVFSGALSNLFTDTKTCIEGGTSTSCGGS